MEKIGEPRRKENPLAITNDWIVRGIIEMETSVFELLMLSIWGKGNPTVELSTFEEMKKQGIALLAAPVLSSINISTDLRKQWELYILQQLSFNSKLKYVQEKLPISVPYTILKGTTAAQYYPYPEFRMMGDIDIFPQRDCFLQACEEFLFSEWVETTSVSDKQRGRHRAFSKEGFTVEVHLFFASMNDPAKAKALDDLIVNNITDTHVLPDYVNGLVLIDHISQHLEEGLGLRHIVDWMMFVDRYLTDESWQDFELLLNKIGLKTLAIVTTRMCEMYLGLPCHQWCAKANEKLCNTFMNYVLTSGNFGNKLNRDDLIAVSRIWKLRHPFQAIQKLKSKERHGRDGLNKKEMTPFSWIKAGVELLKNTQNIAGNYKRAKALNRMFDALEVKRSDEGLVYFEDGEYIKH